MNIRKTLFLAGAFSCAVSLTLAGSADASIKCRSTIEKTIAKYVQAYSKILQKCEEGFLKTGTPGSCPDSKATAALTKLAAKTGPALGKACPAGETGIFTHGRCPDVEGVTADAANCSDIIVQDVADIAACANCVAAEEAQELTEAAYGGFIATTGGSPENKCQIAIGKATAAFFQTKSKLISKCRQGQLKGKITAACTVDQKTVDGIAAAEGKKIAAIAKACGGADKALGPETCQNAGATNGAACTANGDCAVCSDDASACGAAMDCNVCTAGAVGEPCDAIADCRACNAGNVGAHCEVDGNCRVCVGGSNPGTPCPIGVIQCTGGGTCPTVGGSCSAAIANSCAGGTIASCGGGDCRGADEVTKASIGYFAKCPLITNSGVNTGPNVESLQDIVECVDATASTRIDCADAIGASSQQQNLPLACERTIPGCVGDQGAATITITLASTAGNLGAVSIGLGYRDSVIPGSGDLDPVTGPLVPTFFNGQISINDDGRQAIVTIVASDPTGDPITPGVLVNGSANKCLGFVSADDISCVVRDAADTAGATVLDGVTCTVTVM